MWWHDKNIWVLHLLNRRYSDISLTISIILAMLILPAALLIGLTAVVIILYFSMYYLIYGWILDFLWRQPPDIEFPLLPSKDFPDNELLFSYIVFNKLERKAETHISIKEFQSIEETYEIKRD